MKYLCAFVLLFSIGIAEIFSIYYWHLESVKLALSFGLQALLTYMVVNSL